MNPLHYPDIERCKKLTDIGFPPTILAIDQDGTWRVREFTRQLALLPSVMELLDVIPSLIAYDGDSEKPGFLLIKGSIWRKAPFSVAYMNEKAKCYAQPQCSGTLPNALCDLIFWLVDNKYLTFNK